MANNRVKEEENIAMKRVKTLNSLERTTKPTNDNQLETTSQGKDLISFFEEGLELYCIR
jgi:hypothetical protein